ncbi:MAG: N-methyl-L-tryptophan oxidase [Acidimicrobiia bacterium]
MNELSVGVIGTGSIGSMLLWRLAARGVHATGFEQYSPGHDRGAAGGESRIFRLAYREGPGYVPLLRQARELWRELDSVSPHRLFYESGFVTVGAEDEPRMEAIRASARAHGLTIEELGAAEAARRVPEHPVRDGESMILDPAGGLIRPELAVMAAAEQARRLGAEVRSYTKVEEVVDEGGRVSVVTADGAQTFDHVVITTGPWVGGGLLPEGLPLQPKELTATWFPRRDDDTFVLGRTPTAVRLGEPGFSCFPAVDGAGVKVIAHGAFGDIDDPENLPRTAEISAVRRASRFVEEALPGVFPSPVRVATYSDAYTPDDHPIIGRLTQDSRVVLAVGFSGHGFKMAPAFGEELAGIVVGESKPSLDFMGPGRFLSS